MIFQLTVKVDSDAYVEKAQEFVVGKYLIRISGDESRMVKGKQMVSKLSVGVRVARYKIYLMKSNARPTLTNPYKKEIVSLLQHLDGVGIWDHISNVYYREREGVVESWVGENEEEEAAIAAMKQQCEEIEAGRSISPFKVEGLAKTIGYWVELRD